MELNEVSFPANYRSKILKAVKDSRLPCYNVLSEILQISTEIQCEEFYNSIVRNFELEKEEESLDSISEERGHFHGIFIGINAYDKYKDKYDGIEDFQSLKDFNTLNFASHDAIELAKFFYKNKNGGTISLIIDEPIDRQEFERDNKKTFDITYNDPTKSNIIDELSRIAKLAEVEDTILISFSGHGVRKEKEQIDLLITQDYSINDLDSTCLNIDYILDKLCNSLATTIIILIDACREEFEPVRGSVGRLGGFGPFNVPSNKRIVIFYSCQPGQKSIESKDYNHGYFTYHILNALKNNSSQIEGKLMLTDLERMVKRALENESRIDQTPHLIFITETAEKEDVPIVNLINSEYNDEI